MIHLLECSAAVVFVVGNLMDRRQTGCLKF
jgi:hypothetical protein